MHSRSRALPVLVLTLTAACGGPPHGYISRAELGDKWPLTVDDGVLACDRHAVTFTTGGRTYALNGVAAGRGAAPIEAIQKPMTMELTQQPVMRFSEENRKRIFAASVACEDLSHKELETARTMADFAAAGKPQAACEAALRKAHNLTEDELERIGLEGVSHSWPPLPQLRMSVGPLIDRGLKLCD